MQPQSPTSPIYYKMGSVGASDQLPGWAADRAIDLDRTTSYSSYASATAVPDHTIALAAWFSAGTPLRVSEILLTPRVLNGQIMAFPKAYHLFLTAPDNSKWDYLGEFSTQPDPRSAGLQVRIPLGKVYATYGVLVIPSTLGVDNYGTHYFQLAEIQLAYSP